MLKTQCEIGSVGEATDRELSEQVPGALLVLVLDGEGNLTPLRLSKACVARKIDESDLASIGITRLKQLDSMAILGFERNPNCWVLSWGGMVYVC
jgi:hypothetical protein